VIGTYYSPEGHLKNKEPLHIDSENSSRKTVALKYKWCPITEYETTFQITRRAIWDFIDNDKYRNNDTGVGTLLSTILDNNEKRPAIHIMKPKQKYGSNKKVWRQQWITF